MASGEGPDPAGTARRYLEAVASHDWGTAASCLAEDVERHGPFGDTYRGRDPYMAYLRQVMPSLSGYCMHIERVVSDAEGRVALAQLNETVDMEGKPTVTSESLVFDLDDAGLIRSIRIYIQQPG